MAPISVDERRDACDSIVKVLRAVVESPWQLPETELTRVLGDLAELAGWVDAARVAVVAEGLERGTATDRTMAASPTDWVAQSSAGMPVADAARLVRVARACRVPANGVLSEAVLAGRVGVRGADAALREYDRLEPFLVDDAKPAVLAGFVQVATGGEVRDVRRLRQRIVAEHGNGPGRDGGVGAEGLLQREQDVLARHVALSRGFGQGGMLEYLLRLDPESAAVLEAAIDPLSAPRPSTVEGPDLRGADRRRAEALVEIVRRGVAAAEGVPVTEKATLVVTMDLDRLRERSGAGVVLSGALGGELLGPGTVRRLACDGRVVPAVLGSGREPLELGRAVRLATAGLVRALWLRDGGCSFPGCSRPCTWCDAHHVRHWVDGGTTDVGNMALLCARHHTIVHQRDLTATVTATGVTWHT